MLLPLYLGDVRVLEIERMERNRAVDRMEAVKQKLSGLVKELNDNDSSATHPDAERGGPLALYYGPRPVSRILRPSEDEAEDDTSERTKRSGEDLQPPRSKE